MSEDRESRSKSSGGKWRRASWVSIKWWLLCKARIGEDWMGGGNFGWSVVLVGEKVAGGGWKMGNCERYLGVSEGVSWLGCWCSLSRSTKSEKIECWTCWKGKTRNSPRGRKRGYQTKVCFGGDTSSRYSIQRAVLILGEDTKTNQPPVKEKFSMKKVTDYSCPTNQRKRTSRIQCHGMERADVASGRVKRVAGNCAK